MGELDISFIQHSPKQTLSASLKLTTDSFNYTLSDVL